MSAPNGLRAPTAADFRARHRGGGLFTETVNQRLASYVCVVAHRIGAPPTALTLLNLGLGLGASIGVAALAPRMAAGGVPPVVAGLGALLLWQVAYTLDCADGQLARVTGRTSPAGARVDVLCDVALQISLVAAVSAVAAAYHPVPVWLVAAFAGTWMVNLVTSVMAQGAAAQSLVTSRSPLVRAVKLVRDYGAVVTVLALAIAFVPRWTIWVLVAFTLVNGLFLVASIAAAAQASLAAPPATAPAAPARQRPARTPAPPAGG
ncbi:MAG: CDP-alcohol phosphatidyltransferase [Actinobacteria bacterium 13_2_20CM_2_71_6]|nr:MAG: CDP-alcohol phosphatidyltransferase [Actinobacteria bacterium 13_2_20CM_2_71_6]